MEIWGFPYFFYKCVGPVCVGKKPQKSQINHNFALLSSQELGVAALCASRRAVQHCAIKCDFRFFWALKISFSAHCTPVRPTFHESQAVHFRTLPWSETYFISSFSQFPFILQLKTDLKADWRSSNAIFQVPTTLFVVFWTPKETKKGLFLANWDTLRVPKVLFGTKKITQISILRTYSSFKMIPNSFQCIPAGCLNVLHH